MERKSALVTLADEGYLDQVKQFFSSVYHNNAWSSTDDCILLAHNCSRKSTKWFTDHGIIVYHCKPLFEGNPGGMSASLTSKFYMFGPDFKKYDVVIYVDADTSVRGNLNFLKSVKYFAAAQDYLRTFERQFIQKGSILKRGFTAQEIERRKDELGKIYNLSGPAFSAGFFVFRPQALEPDTQEKLISYLHEYGPISDFGEQLIFNMVFYKRWQRLPQVYNMFIVGEKNKYFLPKEKVDAIIMHFTGRIKPWVVKNYYFGEWQRNFERADEINMHKSSLKISWTPARIANYSRYLFVMQKWHHTKEWTRDYWLNRAELSLLLSRKWPRAHSLLTRISFFEQE